MFYGNGYGYGYNPADDNIDQIYNTYKQQQLQRQQRQQQMFANNSLYNNGYINTPPSNNPIGQQGIFKQVREYKEVENASVAADGTPTLFFDFQHGIFYSKKYVEGRCTIQPYSFAPINNTPDNEPISTNSESEASAMPTVSEVTLSAILSKLDELTQRIEKLEPKKLIRKDKEDNVNV